MIPLLTDAQLFGFGFFVVAPVVALILTAASYYLPRSTDHDR